MKVLPKKLKSGILILILKDLQNSLEQKTGMKVVIDNKKNNTGKLLLSIRI